MVTNARLTMTLPLVTTSNTAVAPVTVQVVASSEACSGAFQFCADDSTCRAVEKPLYCLRFFKEAIRNRLWQLFHRREAEKCMDKLEWNYHDLAEFLLAIHTGCFQKTIPQCEINEVEGYEFIDSDQYHAYWDEDNKKCVSINGSWTVSLSFKIAVIVDDEGTLSGVVTLHTDR